LTAGSAGPDAATNYMKKPIQKKLVVPVETVRQLQASELQAIIGGVGATGDAYIHPKTCGAGCGTISNASFDC
jgi:hypothetical protein